MVNASSAPAKNIQWSVVLKIICGWVISPLCAAAFVSLALFFAQRFVPYETWPAVQMVWKTGFSRDIGYVLIHRFAGNKVAFHFEIAQESG